MLREEVVMIDVESTLGDLVTANPALAVELVRLGLDPCCGGQRRFREACADAGLEPEALADQLDAVPGPESPPDWATMGLVQLVDHIEWTHHRYLDAELPRLDELAAKVLHVHGDRHSELADVRRLVAELRVELTPHLAKEERVLFPAIRALAVADTTVEPWLQAPIGVMRMEHDDAGRLLAALRTATHEYRVPADGCASYAALYAGLAELEDDTHLHVHKENNVLFPAVLSTEERRSARSA